MSVKSNLAKFAPKNVVEKGIAKGEHRGDNWSKVGAVISRMCETEHKEDGTVEFIYEGKVIGWARPNGQCWCDDSAYVKMREAYDELPQPEYDEEYDDDYYPYEDDILDDDE